MFKEQTMIFFNREVTLLNPSKCRYASFFIRMMRTLRCKEPLQATVYSVKYIRLKMKQVQPVEVMIKSDKSFHQRSIILTAAYPILMIIRLGDSNGKHMDKLWYYVMKAEEHLLKMKEYLNDEEMFPRQVDEVVEMEGAETDSSDDEEDPPQYESDDDVVEPECSENDIPPTQRREDEPENLGVDKQTLAGMMIAGFLRYKPNFDYDYARAGYMLSVVEEIYVHAKVGKIISFLVTSSSNHYFSSLSSILRSNMPLAALLTAQIMS